MKSIGLGPGNIVPSVLVCSLNSVLPQTLKAFTAGFWRVGLYLFEYKRKKTKTTKPVCFNKTSFSVCLGALLICRNQQLRSCPFGCIGGGSCSPLCLSLVSVLVNFVGLPAVSLPTPLLLLGMMPSISLTVVMW